MENRSYIWDSLLEMAATSVVVAASGAATVDGTAKVYDTGGGFTEGYLVVDVAATTEALSAADEQCARICLQGSSSATFANTVEDLINLAQIEFGMNGNYSSNAVTWDAGAGRYLLPFCNWADDTIYRYLRVYHHFAGTWATGISYSAFLSKR